MIEYTEKPIHLCINEYIEKPILLCINEYTEKPILLCINEYTENTMIQPSRRADGTGLNSLSITESSQ